MTDDEDRILTLEAQVTSLELRMSRVLSIVADLEALEAISSVELKWLCMALRTISEVEDV